MSEEQKGGQWAGAGQPGRVEGVKMCQKEVGIRSDRLFCGSGTEFGSYSVARNHGRVLSRIQYHLRRKRCFFAIPAACVRTM